jgi:uncharacterized repeat protein (TIGR03803 family)
LLAGCGGSESSIAPVHAAPDRAVSSSSSYHVLYNFPGSADDGYYPQAGLIELNGTFYGTTAKGGSACAFSRSGCGTVFGLSASGTEKVLHSFLGTDGFSPAVPLLKANGALYGTTQRGGNSPSGKDCGTVFRISPKGHMQVLHVFGKWPDGCRPEGPLLDVNGTFYGTTLYGGEGSNGTVYSITANGREQVLHSFCSDSDDGCQPVGGLIDVDGTLYGTASSDGSACHCGIVYSITPSGSETQLYHFAGGSDGAVPQAGLVSADGTLYGTTLLGGGSGCAVGHGCGTIYSVTTSGAEQVVHRFTGGKSDGAWPKAALLYVKGIFYGTTSAGGRPGGRCQHDGCGTIFNFTPSGGEKMLFDFKSTFSHHPEASLIDVNNVLYGTTTLRGGSAFTFTPTQQ